MRIAVLNLTGSGMSGGYRSYLRNILPHLAADTRVESLLSVSPASARVEDWVPRSDKLQFETCPPFRPLIPSVGHGLEQQLSAFSPDVIFVPTARTARFRGVPVVTMIQNMAPLVSWKRYGLLEKVRLAAQWLETFKAVRRAERVIAISDFVREFLLKCWGIAEGKIDSIYFGAPAPSVTQVRPSLLPPGWTDFVFTAGLIEPYRSLEDVIGCAQLFRRRGLPLRLAIAGSSRRSMVSYERRLKRAAENAGVSADLCWTGQLSSEEMTWCYKRCSAFIMTSRIEACPTTALEAMACGAVCIAADNPPLPELFAQTALYYKPGDSDALASKISEVLSWDVAKRARVSAAASVRSRDFTWEIAAWKTVGVFEKLCKQEASPS